ncbi:ReoY family proteolytic degradation factor [Virgibacillus ainsalahensis]
MQTPISVQDKKRFIQWFLNHYQLKKRESVWILNYLVNHQEILDKVHFVREVKFCSRGIMMSTHCSKETPFRFYKSHLVTTDAEKSFHDIRLNAQEPLYLQLNFKNANQSSFYVSVLEENPFIPDNYYITEKDQLVAERLLEDSLFEFKRNSLMREIDKSLDEMDQKRFLKLVNQLNKLESSISNQPKLQKQ